VIVVKVDLLNVALTVLHMVIINIESDISLSGFIDSRINDALYDIYQH
jgi:hypothetical protein